MIEKYQKIFKVLKLVIDNASVDSDNNTYLHDQLVIVFRAIKNSKFFQEINRETLENLLLEALQDASEGFSRTFPEDQVRNSINLLSDGDLDSKYLEIMIENLRQYMSQKYLESTKTLINKVIEEEWEEK